MEERLKRKLAAILYADVAGYSRLTGADEDATHRALSDYLDYIAATVASHGGQVMHYAGDAVLAMFPAVIGSMSSAIAIQSELAERNLFIGNTHFTKRWHCALAKRIPVFIGYAAWTFWRSIQV